MTEMQTDDLVPSSDMEAWSRHQVREWALNLGGVDQNSVDILFNQDITGPSLKHLDTTDLTQMGVKFGPAKLIIVAKNEIVKAKAKQCTPYPFGKYAAAHWYIEGDILIVAESGASDLIEPCHEFKAFINTTKMDKFVDEVIRFGASCMNSHTNGTIHFGIMDQPHGKIQGVLVDSKEKEHYDQKLRFAISKRFAYKHKDVAQQCIKPPRFVEVLNRNLTTTGKFVIEVDIVPYNTICKSKVFHTYNAITKEKQLFMREGGSSNILSERRKQLEEKQLCLVRRHMQGSKLCQMITGGTGSLDRSYYTHYIIVTSNSHPTRLDSMRFLIHLRPAIVFDFGHKSAQNRLYKHIQKYSKVIALPEQCTSTMLAKNISLHVIRWLFHSGKFRQSSIQVWFRKCIAFQTVNPFYQKDVFNNKCLVVFLILSEVDQMDPLVETFCTFYQQLKGKEQILCICENENAFTLWKNLIDARCGVDISNRCIYELSFAEVNGTILSLRSKNRWKSRFLPGAGGGRVLLEKKVEHQLTTLDVVCVNQCEGGNEDQVSIEQNFYREGDVSWWNFYFSEQPGSMPFIKRDKFVYIVDTLIPDLCSLRKACVLLNLLHVPGCGGTTLAKHTLWTLREKFRSAVLIDNDADPVTVAEHVVTLLQCGCKEQEPPVPVLLMIDDFKDMTKVFNLQQLIERQCLSSRVQSRSPQVILLNCMRSEHISGPTDPTEDTVFIEQSIFEDQQAKGNIFLDILCQNTQESDTSLSGSPGTPRMQVLDQHMDLPALKPAIKKVVPLKSPLNPPL
ncbi:sterile alpha motif domain-containing protein 9-like [Periophthalmus magnuspinnatus]|uniref:sterile alpha motif domain-containing protein 9-like n=1 Tax=Periophthalmus magnuspinnatus TaxID=409849 RepID=UPI0024369B59|nr:sterile alpha motif domain-containing protein 9-like [Periophthalmus magnuspinnatus]